ncbi:MAG: hypothetical protein OEZ10_00750 [Gammaproteobacteria bacterium]|nr:hypothetical protein [Gammaproteobacteria bacterium]
MKTRVDDVDYARELLRINLLVRETIVPASIRDAVEAIVDTLFRLLAMFENVQGQGSLEWVVQRMITTYLPEKALRPYLALPAEERNGENNVSALSEALTGIQAELDDVEAMIEKQKLSDFDQKAEFLKRRFRLD